MQIDVHYLQNPISTLPQIVSQLPPKTQVPIPQVSVPQVPVPQVPVPQVPITQVPVPRVPVNLSPSNEPSVFLEQLKELKMQMTQLQQNTFLSGSKSNRSYMVPINKDSTSTSPQLHDSVNDSSITLVPSMYSFTFMNVARLITLTKRKNEILSDFCDKSTMFLCLCETLLQEGILDSEIKISGLSIIRCDRSSRTGGGVCVYVFNSTTYDTCLTYSNSVCELLILRLHKPPLIIILMYRPPTCSPEDFNDIICRSRAIILSMSSPLPNIIMLGGFNFPDINWLNPNYNCYDASPLILFLDLLFLNQQVSAPTRKSNILDLIFYPDDFINCIDIPDSVISDHRIITAKTLIPISQSSPPCQTMNSACNTFELLDFRKADWLGLCACLKSVNWKELLYDYIPSKYTTVIIEKLKKVYTLSPSIQSKLADIERDLILSHQKEKLYEESLAVAKIKSDPNDFFQICKEI